MRNGTRIRQGVWPIVQCTVLADSHPVLVPNGSCCRVKRGFKNQPLSMFCCHLRLFYSPQVQACEQLRGYLCAYFPSLCLSAREFTFSALNGLAKPAAITVLPGYLPQGNATPNRGERDDYDEVSSLCGISSALAEVDTPGRA